MDEQNVAVVQNQRPTAVTVLCILTFIWSGLMALVSLIGIFASGWFASLLGDYGGGALGDMAGGILIVIFLISFILWGLSLFGAIKMFGMKKSGYILYMIPNCLMLIGQIIGIFSAFTFGSFLYLLVSILFIVMYGMNLKLMK
jgi:hypothetical protein